MFRKPCVAKKNIMRSTGENGRVTKNGRSKIDSLPEYSVGRLDGRGVKNTHASNNSLPSQVQKTENSLDKNENENIRLKKIGIEEKKRR